MPILCWFWWKSPPCTPRRSAYMILVFHSSLHTTQQFFVTWYPPRKIFSLFVYYKLRFWCRFCADFDENHPHPHWGRLPIWYICFTPVCNFLVTWYPPRKSFLCLFIINYDFDADAVLILMKTTPMHTEVVCLYATYAWL